MGSGLTGLKFSPVPPTGCKIHSAESWKIPNSLQNRRFLSSFRCDVAPPLTSSSFQSEMEPLLHPSGHRGATNDTTTMLRYNSQMSTTSSTPVENDEEVGRLVMPIEFSSSSVPFAPLTLWKRFLVSLLVFLVGWHVPKSFAPSEESIHRKLIPFQVLSTGDVVLDLQLKNPLVQPATIPSHLLIGTAIWIPMLVVALMSCCCSLPFGIIINNNTSSTPWWKRFILHLSILLACIGLSEGTTQVLKLYVLRRRPNFYDLCQFDLSTKLCTAPFEKVLEAQMSFPSGHSSLSFCGMTFLSLYLQDQLVPTSAKSSSLPPGVIIMNRVVSLSPYAWALFVAASRVHDFWHFASDVIAGSLLGTWASWWVWHNCLPSKD